MKKVLKTQLFQIGLFNLLGDTGENGYYDVSVYRANIL